MADNANNQNAQPGIEIKPIKEQKKIHGEFFVTVAVILLLFEAYLFLFLTIPPTSLNNLIIDTIKDALYNNLLIKDASLTPEVKEYTDYSDDNLVLEDSIKEESYQTKMEFDYQDVSIKEENLLGSILN